MVDVLEDVINAPLDEEDTTIEVDMEGHDLNEDLRGEEEQ